MNEGRKGFRWGAYFQLAVMNVPAGCPMGGQYLGKFGGKAVIDADVCGAGGTGPAERAGRADGGADQPPKGVELVHGLPSVPRGGSGLLLCKANAPHQVFESRIRTERIEAGIDFEIDQPNIVRTIRAIEPVESFGLVAESGIHESDFVAPDSVPANIFFEVADQLPRGFVRAHAGIGVSQVTQRIGAIA